MNHFCEGLGSDVKHGWKLNSGKFPKYQGTSDLPGDPPAQVDANIYIDTVCKWGPQIYAPRASSVETSIFQGAVGEKKKGQV